MLDEVMVSVTKAPEKLEKYGCPACKSYVPFTQNISWDGYTCSNCETFFGGLWLQKWTGDPHPELMGMQAPPPLYEEPTEPAYPYMNESYLKLLSLHEKVVKFREAVLNRDSVVTDEDIERLLQEMFDVSYSISNPTGLEADLFVQQVMDTPADSTVLGPGPFDDEGDFHESDINP